MDETFRAELADFLSIPSVSAEPDHAADVRRAGEWVCDRIRAAGGTAELTPVGSQYLALGELRASNGAESAPTVLCYGHFDVQPPAPLAEWESDPFELVVRDGWAYARGIADDKGQLYMLLKAGEELARANALPVNLRYACDGEEEIGGHTIVDFLGADDRGADACIIFDGGMLKQDVPVFDLATRGLVAFDVKVRTGARDLHSGIYGGGALNAIHALMQSLDAVLARNGRLPEPLRAGIVPPTDEELAAWRNLPSGESHLSEQGARPLDAQAAEEFYVRTWAEPSADVNGIIGGKPGIRNTTLSVQASAEFTIRLAPGQDVDTIGAAAERLLREAAPDGAELEVKWAGSPPGLVDSESRAIQLGLDAFERALGIRPLLTRSGGTLPIMGALSDQQIPTILTGFAVPESSVHSPNEKMRVDYFERGLAAARELYTALGDLRS
ncbi:MAG TPA: M20/M25/M40 family metallo-hydrolase [Gaiellaceae bacterium]|jgi:acetylornithine deacetylase/succinyl-diaminopimelate desuccinylase-like protein